MNLISPVHLLFIAAFALIFIGPKRLPEVARSLGSGMREFRQTLNAGAPADRAGELAATPDDATTPPPGNRVAPAPAGPFA